MDSYWVKVNTSVVLWAATRMVLNVMTQVKNRINIIIQTGKYAYLQ